MADGGWQGPEETHRHTEAELHDHVAAIRAAGLAEFARRMAAGEITHEPFQPWQVNLLSRIVGYDRVVISMGRSGNRRALVQELVDQAVLDGHTVRTVGPSDEGSTLPS